MIAMPFLRLLKFFYGIAPNYGVAIILLTVLVRLLAAADVDKRPALDDEDAAATTAGGAVFGRRYKDDKEQLHREMIELYKRNHVNPMGGCLPMVVQLPVFFGLY